MTTISQAQLERIKDRLELARKHDQTSTALIDEAVEALGIENEGAREEATDVLLEWALWGDGVEDDESLALERLADHGIHLTD
ncbi:MAG: hypothetical protein AAF170_08440 [Bacteroidota bacterium]